MVGPAHLPAEQGERKSDLRIVAKRGAKLEFGLGIEVTECVCLP